MADSVPLLFTSDISKFLDVSMNDDAAERAKAFAGNQRDIILCEIVRFATRFEREMAASVEQLFHNVLLPNYSEEERRQLFMHIKGLVDNVEQMSANALLPFIMHEQSTHIVSTAAIDYVAVGTIINNDPLGRAKDIVSLIRSGNITNVGAAFGGLLHFGDRRVCQLIWPLRDLLAPHDVQTAIQCTTGLVYASTVEFEIDWLEELDGTTEDAVFAHLAAGLVQEVRTSQMEVVVTGPRVFPVPKRQLSEKEQQHARDLANLVPIEEYANRIASRLYAIERTEPPPRIMPHVLSAWGLSPQTDLAEALPVDDRTSTPSSSHTQPDTGQSDSPLLTFEEEWFDGEGHIFLLWGILNPNGPTLYCLGERDVSGQQRFFFRWMHMLGGCTYFGQTLAEGEITYEAIYEAACYFAFYLAKQGAQTPFDVIPSFVIPNNGDATIGKIAATLISADAPETKDWGREVAYLQAFGADYFQRAGCEIRVAYEEMKAKPALSDSERQYLTFIEARYSHIPAFRDAVAPSFFRSGFTQELFDHWWSVVNTPAHMVSGFENLVAMWRGAQSVLSESRKPASISIETVIQFLVAYGFGLPEENSALL